MNQQLTNEKVQRDSTRNQNFNGRRITNASASQAPTDYTIRQELDDEISKLKTALASKGINIE